MGCLIELSHNYLFYKGPVVCLWGELLILQLLVFSIFQHNFRKQNPMAWILCFVHLCFFVHTCEGLYSLVLGTSLWIQFIGSSPPLLQNRYLCISIPTHIHMYTLEWHPKYDKSLLVIKIQTSCLKNSFILSYLMREMNCLNFGGFLKLEHQEGQKWICQIGDTCYNRWSETKVSLCLCHIAVV